ncbi:MAG TPA: hypothetical protein VIL46_04500 [Gemmataceae bacterium]
MTRTQRAIEEHRRGEACVEVRDRAGRPRAGVPVWAEQEAHAFAFGCAAPDLGALAEPDRRRCAERLGELFNRIIPAGEPPDPGVLRFDVPDAVHLGRLRAELDRLAPAGVPLHVYVRGRCVGSAEPLCESSSRGEGEATYKGGGEDERAAAERLAALYSLCFAHPAVGGIFWVGFWDGEEGAGGGGLLRRDFAPKPAFRYLQKLIGTVWHTRASGATDAAGRFRFRGFRGDYRVAARAGEEPATTGRLTLREGVEGRVVLEVPGGTGDRVRS